MGRAPYVPTSERHSCTWNAASCLTALDCPYEVMSDSSPHTSPALLHCKAEQRLSTMLNSMCTI